MVKLKAMQPFCPQSPAPRPSWSREVDASAALTTILPAMSLAAAREPTRIHRVAGLTGGCTACITTRPFRASCQAIPPCGKGFTFGTRLQLTPTPRPLNRWLHKSPPILFVLCGYDHRVQICPDPKLLSSPCQLRPPLLSRALDCLALCTCGM
jgi:hypothetical protein